MNETTVETPKAGRREWIGLGALALACVLYSMDLTVLHLAVPELSADLQPSSSQLLWIVDIYGFMLAGSLITMGTLGDRIGRRRLLLIGAAAFGAASLFAAFSTSAEMLIVARALLGVAGATLAPSTLSLIRSMFDDPRQRTVAIGVWITSFSAGAVIGPPLGGVLLEFFWWGSVFLLAVPVMGLLLVLGPLLLPEYRDPDAGRLDLVSAALSLVAVLAVIYGLKQVAQDGMGWPPAVSVLGGLAVGAVFVRRQQRLADPLIDLRLFRLPAFSASLATYMLATFVAFGAFLFIFQYLQLVLGLSPLRAALWTVPSFTAFIVGAMLTPVIVRRVRPAYVMAARPGGRGRRLRAAHPSRRGLRADDPRDRVRRVLAGRSAGLHPGDRPDRRNRTARARRSGLGHLGDELRARWGPRHRDPGQHRRCRLPRPGDR
jgi:MFS transporter, DHA2 family, multidrug resistance protein